VRRVDGDPWEIRPWWVETGSAHDGTVSVRARTRFAVVAAVVVGLAGATCSPGRSENSSDGKTPWAQDAVELFESIARDLSDVDRHAAAKAFADEGILDLRAWGG